jgi:hypothetical protein
MPLSATIKSQPATTIDIVSADLAFLSLKASKDSMKICHIKNKGITHTALTNTNIL